MTGISDSDLRAQSDDIAALRAENATLRKALQRIADEAPAEYDNDSLSYTGNPDDEYYRGLRNGGHFQAEIARAALSGEPQP